MKDAFGGSEGLGVICTNPPDYLVYFTPEIFGWDRDQVVGFNHPDTYRLRNLKSPVKLARAWMLGDHSPNSFAHFTPDIYTMLHAEYKGDAKKIDKRIKEIIQEVHKKGFQIFEVMGHSNVNCAFPLADVAEGIITGQDALQMSYYIELPAEMPEELLQELTDLQNLTQIEINGVCTGVPVIFKKKKGVFRAELAPEFGKGHVFDTAVLDSTPAALEYSEKKRFFPVLMSNAKEILTAKQYGKEHDGHALFPTENTLLVISNVLSNELLLYETKKDIYDEDPSILFKNKKSTHACSGPEVTAVAADGNQLVTITGGLAQLWKLPYKNISDTPSSTKNDVQYVTDLGKTEPGVRQITLKDNEVYLASSKDIEKRDLSGNSRVKTSLDIDIWSILAHDSSLFCSCSDGRVIELDSSLKQKAAYHTTNSNSKIIKSKVIEFNGKQYLFGINDSGDIYMWKPGETKAAKRWHSKKSCFDVQTENHKEGSIVCVYAIGEDDLLEIKRILPATDSKIDTVKTNIQCSAVKDIQAKGNEVFLIANNRVRSILNQETPNLDISLSDKFVKQVCTVQYKK
jgi:hypothetical protein